MIIHKSRTVSIAILVFIAVVIKKTNKIEGFFLIAEITKNGKYQEK